MSNKIITKYKNLEPNDKIVLKNTLFAFFIKGGALAISLLSTPAFINYFNNNEVLGVWYTMLSVLIWFLNFDFGLGNGIRNNLVKAFTAKDEKKAKYIISSGMFSVGIIAILLFIIGITILKNVNLNNMFNISESIISGKVLFLSSLFVLVAILIRFFLTTISSIFYALQKSAINNFTALCVSILQLLFVLLFRFDNVNDSLINLSFSYMVISNLPVLIAGIIIFCTTLKKCRPNICFIRKDYIKMVMKIGGMFFFCQILYMLIANTNEFLISKLFGPNFTTEYTFYYKITSLVSMVITLAMTPIWSTVTKAMEEKNWNWLNSLYKKIKSIGLVIIALEFLIIPFLQIIMNIWLHENSIQINYLTAIAFACFGSTFVYSGMLSTIVCGMARMKLQSICYSIGVIVKLLIVFIGAKYVNDWTIVVWSNAIILLPYCILQQIDLNKYLKNKLLVGIN